MKNRILQLFFLVVCFCIFPMISKAECSASEKVQLNTQASYLTYDYTYNGDNTFNVTFDNVTSSLAVEYNDDIYSATKSGITIKNIPEGTIMNLKVLASKKTNCYEDVLRVITYRIPYYNRFLDRAECQNYPEIEICQTKFLSYFMSDSLFESMFEKQKEELLETEEPTIVEEDTWVDILVDYLWAYGMQTGLFLVGTICMYILGHSAVKRAKAKF